MKKALVICPSGNGGHNAVAGTWTVNATAYLMNDESSNGDGQDVSIQAFVTDSETTLRERLTAKVVTDLSVNKDEILMVGF